jgi:hypothetical protein
LREHGAREARLAESHLRRVLEASMLK